MPKGQKRTQPGKKASAIFTGLAAYLADPRHEKSGWAGLNEG
ncbi:hypothetical protein B4135_2688 [Caldibacillus debilis]|uniref:Uncharacterized protein n=1 Tax=Caldibacillus debilis TaxID=301148 RepID=A0A150LS82_9BACI|nr:hypothetical protein B4135_2688 [Caldibacillus debilis]